MVVYIRNTCHIKKSKKKYILVRGVQKTDFFDFPEIFTNKNMEIRKSWPEILESRVRRPGNLE